MGDNADALLPSDVWLLLAFPKAEGIRSVAADQLGRCTFDAVMHLSPLFDLSAIIVVAPA